MIPSALSTPTSRPLVATSSSRVPDYLVPSAWHEHAPFLFWLMDALRPRCFVELGTHFGYSYFVGCQAVQELGLGTACYAIDTWHGDEHSGFYGEEVFQRVRLHNQSRYAAFSQLVRATFDEAVHYFSDNSIDLLHIDGRHLYDDVCRDFTSWRPKLTGTSVVLFHDTSERERNFGVWKLFGELSRDHPAFEFTHGRGLGVLAPGRVPAAVARLFAADEQTIDFLRATYAALGAAIATRWQCSVVEERRQQEGARLQQQIVSREDEILALQLQLADREREAAGLEQEIAECNADAESLRQETAAHKEEVAALQDSIAAATAKANHTLAAYTERLANYRQWLADARCDASRRTSELSRAAVEAEQRVTRLTSDQQKLRADYDHLLGSLSWRITSPVRRIFIRYPRSSRRIKSLARLALWIATFRYARLTHALRERARIRREEALLRGNLLFDADFYLQTTPEAALVDRSPLWHYLVRGRWAGRRPHPLFDGEWYLGQNPDVARAGINPLIHFVEFGIAGNRNPNPFFDLAWYGQMNPDAVRSRLDPLTHFMTIGAACFADPSPAFNSRWYLDQNPDVAALGVNPLAHFLLQGKHEGRWPRLPEADFASSRPVTAARIDCRKRPVVRAEVALFVTHSPDGGLRPHVRPYLKALSREGIGIVLIVATDNGCVADEPWLYDLVDGLFVRENQGFDFAAWAHVLRLHRELYQADILYWLNDSLIGPVSDASFHAVIERIRSTPADLVGLTDNYERGWHIQSYFLALKRNALRFYALHWFISGIVAFRDKDDVINTYEVKLAPSLAAAGLAVTSLFKAKSRSNPTIYHWRELLVEGFPFIKIMTIRDEIPGVNRSGWQEALDEQGFDVALAEHVLAGGTEGADRETGSRRKQADTGVPANPRKDPRVAFIGPWNFDNGLGVASRGYLSALMHSGLQTNFLPVEPPFHIHRRVTPTVHVCNFVGPADIAVVHLNPEAWDVLLTPEQRAAIDSARIKIGAFIWESRKLPACFHQLMPKVDAVWAPSRYCADIFRSATSVPVHVMPFPVAGRPRSMDPAELEATRRQLGLPTDAHIILFALDASSYLARKNPSALVAAFRASGLAASGWHLVLKMKHSSDNIAGTRALRLQVDDCPGVSVIDRPMGGSAMAALMEAADIYASPHSSEGFGLTIAEAMALGKIVVATDYGGNRDFLDSETGFPVRFSEWQLEKDEGAYIKGTIWARVDEDHLVERLVAAASLNADARQALGERARRRIRDLLSPEAIAAQMRASIDCLCNR